MVNTSNRGEQIAGVCTSIEIGDGAGWVGAVHGRTNWVGNDEAWYCAWQRCIRNTGDNRRQCGRSTKSWIWRSRDRNRWELLIDRQSNRRAGNSGVVGISGVGRLRNIGTDVRGGDRTGKGRDISCVGWPGVRGTCADVSGTR